MRLAVILCAFVAVTPRLGAQPNEPGSPIRVVGRVTDTRGHALGGASIEVDRTFWRTTSRADGMFSFALPAGTWQIRIRALGYQPAARALEAGPEAGAAPDTLNVTLADAPAELRGVIVNGTPRLPMASTVTSETVRQLPPMGEPDIMRLLPMLPAVSQPNDLIGRLHFAGGGSDEHATYLAGHPLQAPFHVLSVLGAFDVASLDHADVLIHHLPAAMDGRLSGAVQLEPRRVGAPSRDIDVGLLSASVTATQPSVAGAADVLASARVTYLDRVLGHYAKSTGASDDLSLPSFRDGLVMLRRRLTAAWSADVLAYGTTDTWAFDNRPQVIPPRWGEGLLGGRLSYDDDQWHVAMRQSIDRASVRYQEPNDIYIGSTVQPVLDYIDVRQYWTSASLTVERRARRWSASGGIGLDARDHADRWSTPRASSWFSPSMPERYADTAHQKLWGAFGEASIAGSARWSATAGAHATRLGTRAYLSPRAVLTARVTDDLHLDLSADRRHQFDAVAEEPREGSITEPTFLLDRPRIADMLALSGTWERVGARSSSRREWYSQWGGQIVAYARRDRDRTLLERPLDPASSGSVVDTSAEYARTFPRFQRAPGRSIGASISAHVVLPNETIVQGSYTAQRVRERVDSMWRPTEWDAPHTLNLFAGVPIGRGWTVTSALQIHSGMAITPVAMRLLVPVPPFGYAPRFIYGAPYSVRLPTYRRVDLGLRREWNAFGANWATSFQVLNVLATTNPLERDWAAYFLCARLSGCNEFNYTRNGLPILPSVGLEVHW